MVDVTPRWKEPRRPKRRDRAKAMRDVRHALEERASYTCEFPFCQERGTEAHHLLRRSQGGRDTLDNLVLLCGGCHTWVHANPAEALEMGFLRRSSR